MVPEAVWGAPAGKVQASTRKKDRHDLDNVVLLDRYFFLAPAITSYFTTYLTPRMKLELARDQPTRAVWRRMREPTRPTEASVVAPRLSCAHRSSQEETFLSI